MAWEDCTFFALKSADQGSMEGSTLLKDAAQRGMKQALTSISKRFELSEPRSRLAYHNSNHTASVIMRTLDVLAISRKYDPGSVTDREMALGMIAASFHDTVQEWREVKQEDGSIIRDRSRFDNEVRSADEAIAFMESENAAAGLVVFSDVDKARVRSAIMGTVPEFVDGTVVQPNVTAESDIVTRAVALADLGGAGMLDYVMGPDQKLHPDPYTAFENSTALFRERNLDIFDAVLVHRACPIPVGDQDAYRARMQKALEDEVIFIQEREKRLPAEIAGFPPAVQQALMARFAYFSDSIAFMKGAVDEFKSVIDFDEAATIFGYEIPN